MIYKPVDTGKIILHECQGCYAIVRNMAPHDDWHTNLAEMVNADVVIGDDEVGVTMLAVKLTILIEGIASHTLSYDAKKELSLEIASAIKSSA